MSKIGRPKNKSVYLEGELNRLIVNVIRSTGGLTATRDEILITGIKINPGKPPSRFPISMPTLVKIAKQAGIKLKRGRHAV